MMTILKNKAFWLSFAAIVGAIAGFMYWWHVGCTNGACIIGSTWYVSSAYGAVLGILLVRSFTEK